MTDVDLDRKLIQRVMSDPKYLLKKPADGSQLSYEEAQTQAMSILDQLNSELAHTKDAGLEEIWEFMMCRTGQGWDVLVVSHGENGNPPGHVWTIRAGLNDAIRVPGAKAVVPVETDDLPGDFGWIINSTGGAVRTSLEKARAHADMFTKGPTGDCREDDQLWPLMEYWEAVKFRHKLRHSNKG
ncbi:MAG: hypothetical protein ACK5XN_00375 [Bacteroidota bacterium]|jgi:hypothetical protein